MAGAQQSLSLGAFFTRFEDLKSAVFDWGKREKTLFVMGDSKKSKCYSDGSVNYEYVTFVCKQGGKTRPSRSQGIRPKQSSLKCGCPVKVRATASRKDGTLGYKIIQLCLEHNHSISDLIYQAYPENRRAEVTESVGVLLQCPSISNKDLRHHIQESQNKIVLASDVRNLKLKQSDRPGSGDLAEVDKYLQQVVREGGNVEFGHNDDGSFHYLVYITDDMRKLLHLYPECLVLDSTYKTNVYMLPLTTVMCIDSEGCGHPVMHAFVRYEDTCTVQKCLCFFRNQYDSLKTSTFFVDKDFAEISALHNVFPAASVCLCLFHVKCAVKRNLQGKNLPSHLVSCILDLFLRQQSAFTEEEFMSHKSEICAIAPPFVVQYFERNWWANSESWATFKNLHVPQLHLTTTNHLESYHSKIKSSLHCKLPLSQTLTNIHKYDKQLFRSACVRDALTSMRKRYNVSDSDPVLAKITDDLSVFAAKFVCHQYQISKKIHYDVASLSTVLYSVSHSNDAVYSCSLSSCSCKTFVNMNLPCRHMFFLRRFLGKTLYEPVSSEHRFSQHSSLQSQHSDLHGVDGGSIASMVSQRPLSKSVLSPEEKFLAAEKLVSQFSSFLTLVGTQDFYHKMDQLDTLLSTWKNNQNVIILEVVGQSESDGGVSQSVAEGDVVEYVAEGGVGQSVTENGIGQSVTVTDNGVGQSVTVTDNGVGQSVTVTENGVGQSVTDNGIGQSVTDNGIGHSVTENGIGQSVTENGVGQSVTVTENGVGQSVTDNGIGQSVTVTDNGIGQSVTVTENGVGQSVTDNGIGQSVTVTDNGSGQSVTENGIDQSVTVTENGVGQSVTVTENGVGQSVTVTENGVGQSVTEGGVSESVTEGGVDALVAEGSVGQSVAEGGVAQSVAVGFSSVLLRPVKVKGRPKVRQTFTRRKRKTKIPQKFVSCVVSVQQNILLSGIVQDYDSKVGVCFAEEDIKTPRNISSAAVDESASIQCIRDHFSDSAFLCLLQRLDEKVQNNLHVCPACDSLDDGTLMMSQCEHCLQWYHFECVGLRSNYKAKTWFCTDCWLSA